MQKVLGYDAYGLEATLGTEVGISNVRKIIARLGKDPAIEATPRQRRNFLPAAGEGKLSSLSRRKGTANLQPSTQPSSLNPHLSALNPGQLIRPKSDRLQGTPNGAVHPQMGALSFKRQAQSLNRLELSFGNGSVEK